MIEVKSLYKSFEDKEVLKDINSVFENGKTNLIIGQSGSGKTVLMKCIVGLFRPTSGEVLYDGRDLVTMNKQEWKMLRREMGMIFQSAALFDSMTVLENVMFPLDMFSKDSYAERVKRAQFCLDRVNLLEAQKKFPDEISGGMQKRVAIARASIPCKLITTLRSLLPFTFTKTPSYPSNCPPVILTFVPFLKLTSSGLKKIICSS